MLTATSPVDAADVVSAVPDDHVLILFGATGDLARRKLLPGLFHLAVAGMLPAGFRIVGSGRPEDAPDADAFRADVRRALEQFGRREVSDDTWGPFASRLSFAPATAEDPRALLDAITKAEAELGTEVRRLIYLAIPPQAFAPIINMLGDAKLTDRAAVVIEKPFGSDLASARALNQTLHACFDESQIFRIDHFLGKEAVQNIMAFRFANGLFEPVWNRRHVAYVQIDVPEQLTIEGRAAFFEQTGTFRDMVVTHLLHVLGFVAMEPPGHLDARSLRDATGKVFDAIKPLDPARAVFGQYDGYRREPGVAADSTVETFAAVEVEVDNPRWSGVPFYLRTGKAMAAMRRTITLGFKEPFRELFDHPSRSERSAPRPNELTFELSDPGVIWIDFLAKEPGTTMAVGPASLTFRYGESFDVGKDLEAYERLLHDAMLGDHTLFTRADGIERLWEISAPLLELPPRPAPYPQASWGPAAAEQLVAPHRWHLPYPTRRQR